MRKPGFFDEFDKECAKINAAILAAATAAVAARPRPVSAAPEEPSAGHEQATAGPAADAVEPQQPLAGVPHHPEAQPLTAAEAVQDSTLPEGPHMAGDGQAAGVEAAEPMEEDAPATRESTVATPLMPIEADADTVHTMPLMREDIATTAGVSVPIKVESGINIFMQGPAARASPVKPYAIRQGGESQLSQPVTHQGEAASSAAAVEPVAAVQAHGSHSGLPGTPAPLDTSCSEPQAKGKKSKKKKKSKHTSADSTVDSASTTQQQALGDDVAGDSVLAGEPAPTPAAAAGTDALTTELSASQQQVLATADTSNAVAPDAGETTSEPTAEASTASVIAAPLAAADTTTSAQQQQPDGSSKKRRRSTSMSLDVGEPDETDEALQIMRELGLSRTQLAQYMRLINQPASSPAEPAFVEPPPPAPADITSAERRRSRRRSQVPEAEAGQGPPDSSPAPPAHTARTKQDKAVKQEHPPTAAVAAAVVPVEQALAPPPAEVSPMRTRSGRIGAPETGSVEALSDTHEREQQQAGAHAEPCSGLTESQQPQPITTTTTTTTTSDQAGCLSGEASQPPPQSEPCAFCVKDKAVCDNTHPCCKFNNEGDRSGCKNHKFYTNSRPNTPRKEVPARSRLLSASNVPDQPAETLVGANSDDVESQPQPEVATTTNNTTTITTLDQADLLLAADPQRPPGAGRCGFCKDHRVACNGTRPCCAYNLDADRSACNVHRAVESRPCYFCIADYIKTCDGLHMCCGFNRNRTPWLCIYHAKAKYNPERFSFAAEQMAVQDPNAPPPPVADRELRRRRPSSTDDQGPVHPAISVTEAPEPGPADTAVASSEQSASVAPTLPTILEEPAASSPTASEGPAPQHAGAPLAQVEEATAPVPVTPPKSRASRGDSQPADRVTRSAVTRSSSVALREEDQPLTAQQHAQAEAAADVSEPTVAAVALAPVPESRKQAPIAQEAGGVADDGTASTVDAAVEGEPVAAALMQGVVDAVEEKGDQPVSSPVADRTSAGSAQGVSVAQEGAADSAPASTRSDPAVAPAAQAVVSGSAAGVWLIVARAFAKHCCNLLFDAVIMCFRTPSGGRAQNLVY